MQKAVNFILTLNTNATLPLLLLLLSCLGHTTSLMPLLTVSLISEKLEKNALQTHLFHSTWFRLILNFKLAFYRNH